MKPKILFFDIETAPIQAYIWQTGKQYVSHNQLIKGHDQYRIICITYCWDDDKSAKCIDWGYESQDTRKVIEEFDKIAEQADLLVGKNSDRFDIKMINAARMFAGLPGRPNWVKCSDDIEKQMRKYFRVPSQSLDYYSKHLNLGGKIRMEFQDWIDIVEKNKDGQKALAKMIKYGKKDVEDTRKLWRLLSSHFDSKFNNATFNAEKFMCKHADCGSTDLSKDGTVVRGGCRYQQFKCHKCGRYAGRSLISETSGKLGGIK